jgi:arginyl-tRNA synthetase
MRKVVVKIIKKALEEKGVNLKSKEIDSLIETPPNPEMGDYAFPCFFLSEKLKDEPAQIAREIREKIGTPPATDFEDIQTKGPYINFFVNRGSLARMVVWDVINQKKNYGKTNVGKRKKIVVEFSSPNIAKPFGIGHLRSTIIGNAIANICEFQGFSVTRVNYLGDWGTQFGKLLFGYKKFGSDKKLEKEPIKHLFDIYVKANKKQYEKKAREEFMKLEKRDKDSLLKWKLFRDFSLEEFQKIYETFGIEFDVYEGESTYNRKTKKVIQELEKKELLKKSKGAKIVDLKEHGLGVALIEKSDGATLYATRDLAAAISRYKKYEFDMMVYEVGQEQNLYFRQLFKILELMGYDWAKNCVHVDHGLYLNKSGKRFASRKGKIIFMQDIIDETKELAKREIKKRDKNISEKELNERAMKIAIAAIFYGDLKNNRQSNIVFDLKKFVSFDGDTGPYILYSYARASSIMTKAPPEKKFDIGKLEDAEIGLVKKLSEFPDIVLNAYTSLNPSVIATYSYQLAQSFNEFYHACKVIGAEENESFRLALTQSFRQVLRNALRLLGIETIEKM